MGEMLFLSDPAPGGYEKFKTPYYLDLVKRVEEALPRNPKPKNRQRKKLRIYDRICPVCCLDFSPVKIPSLCCPDCLSPWETIRSRCNRGKKRGVWMALGDDQWTLYIARELAIKDIPARVQRAKISELGGDPLLFISRQQDSVMADFWRWLDGMPDVFLAPSLLGSRR
jgi:hypothetical protein